MLQDPDPPGGRPVVLLVEDSSTVRHVVRRALGDFTVVEALDGPAGVAAAFAGCPDVVLLDRYLPGQDGLEVLRELVADERTRDVPVIFLTGDDDPATLVTALEAGAHDFVRKPFLAQELVARVRGAARLKRLGDELRRAASRDPLTGLLNRRAMLAELQRWSALHQRYGAPVSVLVGDLSGFKRVNDEHGHAAGDQALLVVADLLQQAARRQDAVGRWGGDEFVVLLPHTDEVGARLLADRLVELVAHAVVDVPGGARVQVGITIGVAGGPTEPGGADMLHRADQDLYVQRGDRER
ncbi:MAG: response regulator receiver modulated diguanylate cyclase [Frankiales bacterium]|nr:response regulator receiver modulated diguanylate cyclase [Frankiales bacterium]